jgi:hypothetical protein
MRMVDVWLLGLPGERATSRCKAARATAAPSTSNCSIQATAGSRLGRSCCIMLTIRSSSSCPPQAAAAAAHLLVTGAHAAAAPATGAGGLVATHRHQLDGQLARSSPEARV